MIYTGSDWMSKVKLFKNHKAKKYNRYTSKRYPVSRHSFLLYCCPPKTSKSNTELARVHATRYIVLLSNSQIHDAFSKWRQFSINSFIPWHFHLVWMWLDYLSSIAWLQLWIGRTFKRCHLNAVHCTTHNTHHIFRMIISVCVELMKPKRFIISWFDVSFPIVILGLIKLAAHLDT